MKPRDRWCPFAACNACIWAGGTEPKTPDDDQEGDD